MTDLLARSRVSQVRTWPYWPIAEPTAYQTGSIRMVHSGMHEHVHDKSVAL